MDIILSIEDVDLQECELLVTGFFQDERPMKGTSGLIDWRLNGTISHLVKQGKMTGEWQETTLIPSHGRLIPPLILFLGLGKVKEYSTLRLRDLFPRLFDTLRNLKSSKVCFSFPSNETYNVDCGKSAEVLLEGMADCFNSGASLDEDWAGNLQLFFAMEEEKFPEILLGVQTAQSILKDRLKMRIFTASEKRPAGSLPRK
jgi:Cytosol aminopeptidase family, N-terminal domain